MRKLYIFLTVIAFVIFFQSSLVNAQCIPNGITTNPDNPVNPEKPSKTNTFFDWRLDVFSINSVYTSSPQIESPFNQDGNVDLSHFLENPDRLPQDGWELIKYDMGLEEDGTPNATATGFLYLVLYNKYTGVLRVFIAGDQVTPYNGAQIKVKFNSNLSIVNSSALSNASEFFALDQFENNPSQTSFMNYSNDATKWFYADFHMSYDPCTCFYESSMHIEVSLIEEANIELKGKIEGTITSIDNKTGNVSDDGYSIKEIVSAGKKAKKSFDGISKFVKKQEEALNTEGKTALQLQLEGFVDKATKVKKLKKFQEVIKKSDFLKKGLKLAPYIGGAVELVDFFIGGGKSTGSQEVKIMPMAMQADVTLSGSLISTYSFTDVLFHTPGSKNAEVKNPILYPYYNEILGVFNLVETPELMYKRVGNRLYFKMTEFNYAINNAVFTGSPEIYASIQIELLGYDADKTVFLTNELISMGSNKYNSGYIPADCLSNFVFGYQDYGDECDYQYSPEDCDYGQSLPFAIPSSLPKKAFVKLLINLPTPGNHQNVLMVAKYPIDLVQDNLININVDEDLSGISSSSTILKNTALTENIQTWKSVSIESNVTFQSGISIAAQEGVIIHPGNTIPPGVTISSELTLTSSCSGLISPMSSSEINSFCNSSKYYKASRENARVEEKEGTGNFEKQEANNSVAVFPNANNGIFSISLSSDLVGSKILMYNLQGRLIYEKLADSNQFKIDMGGNLKGVYILKVVGKTERHIKKVIVR